MAITDDERRDLARACETATATPGRILRGGDNRVRIHISDNGHVVVTLLDASDMEAWISECSPRRGAGSLTTNTKARTLTFPPA